LTSTFPKSHLLLLLLRTLLPHLVLLLHPRVALPLLQVVLPLLPVDLLLPRVALLLLLVDLPLLPVDLLLPQVALLLLLVVLLPQVAVLLSLPVVVLLSLLLQRMFLEKLQHPPKVVWVC